MRPTVKVIKVAVEQGIEGEEHGAFVREDRGRERKVVALPATVCFSSVSN